ncbi:MAG: NAD-dependent epimerase/dehydratase family protein [Nanoarchaeota archaeon]
MKAMVTGGAGFIGSHIVDRLVSLGYEVVVIDDFSTGQEEFLAKSKDKITIIRKDLTNLAAILPHFSGCTIVFHLAANADVRHGLKHTRRDIEQNTLVTYNVLEAMRRNNVKRIVFSSTGSIYGEHHQFPTPEDAAFPVQTSLYGTSKLACEGLIEAFCEGFEMQGYIFRFVSVMGERYTHGCVYDFMKNLQKDPSTLHILGNGKQRKSYIYIQDLVDAIFFTLSHSRDKVNIYNLGTDEYVDVNEIAQVVLHELALKNVKLTYGGGVRGWIGDSPFIWLSIAKLQRLGFSPKKTIKEAIVATVQYLDKNRHLFAARV